MAFKITELPTFTRDVPVLIPHGEAHVEQSLKTVFKMVADEALDDFNLLETQGSIDTVKAVVQAFPDVEGIDGSPRASTPELIEELARVPYIRQAVLNAYFTNITKVKRN